MTQNLKIQSLIDAPIDLATVRHANDGKHYVTMEIEGQILPIEFGASKDGSLYVVAQVPNPEEEGRSFRRMFGWDTATPEELDAVEGVLDTILDAPDISRQNRATVGRKLGAKLNAHKVSKPSGGSNRF